MIQIVVTPTLRGSGAPALTLPTALGREGPSGIRSAHWGLGQFRVFLPCVAGWGPQRLPPGAAQGAGHPQHSVITRFWMLPLLVTTLTSMPNRVRVTFIEGRCYGSLQEQAERATGSVADR